MEKFNRAERRHHVARLKRARRRYWGMWLWGFNPNDPSDIGRIGKLVHTCQACSCLGCGNQRQYEGLTRAERLNVVDLQQQLKELNMK